MKRKIYLLFILKIFDSYLKSSNLFFDNRNEKNVFYQSYLCYVNDSVATLKLAWLYEPPQTKGTYIISFVLIILILLRMLSNLRG